MHLPKTLSKFIFRFILEQKTKFLLLVLFSILSATNDALFPYFLKRIVDTLPFYEGHRGNIYVALQGTLILLVLFWCVMEVIHRLQGVVEIYTFPRFRANIREAVFNYVKSHSHEYFASNFAGNIAKKLADLPTSCHAFVEIVIFQLVVATTGALLVLIMMWYVQPVFSIIVFIWLCLHLGITLLFLRFGNDLWETHSDAVSVLSGKIVDVFTNIANVRLFSRGKYELKYLQHFQRDEIKKATKAMWWLEITRVGLGLSGLFLIFGVVFTLLYGWVHHWVTFGDFTQVGMQSFWLLGWIWFVSYQMAMLAREAGVIANGLTIIQKGHDLVDKKEARPIHISRGEIRWENVSFAYHKKRPIFEHMNVVIPPGKKVGLVGFSGSGKTTFVNLILRFYDLNKGSIIIDGQNIADVTQDSLRSQIALIPQDPSLFHRTLMENIRYGRLDATDEEVIEASKLAHCHEFIEKLDEGYHSLVGERGIKLSGGQRQRIAIARAILKNAPILILDEATSSLDSVTEKMIQESLHRLMKGRTTIVVAHRLSTLTHMDSIVVFHKGKIVEEGTKEELLKANHHFATLWKMQTDGFLPDKE